MIVNGGAKGFIPGLNLLKKISKKRPARVGRLTDEPLNPLKKISFPDRIGRVNGLYFWPEVDAEKSVKYVFSFPY